MGVLGGICGWDMALWLQAVTCAGSAQIKPFLSHHNSSLKEQPLILA